MLKQIIILICGLIFVIGIAFPVCLAENPWWIRINIPEFKLYLYYGKDLWQKYEVAVGKFETPSPVGEFWIINKIFNPTWYPPGGGTPVPAGPGNPLGKYWMGLNKKGYGIHGNADPYSIGSSVSQGCFRMHNDDIEQLYNIVPSGTYVQITYTTVFGNIDKNNQAWLEVFPDIYNWVNQTAIVQHTIAQLNWKYEPHQKALHKLLGGKKPLKIQLPRIVKVEGDLQGIDAFYWEGSVYISKEVLKVLQTTQSDISDSRFADYLKVETVMSMMEGISQYYWNQKANTIKILQNHE